MARKLKKTNLLFLILVALFVVGYLYSGDITGLVVSGSDTLTEEDIILYDNAIESNSIELCQSINFDDFMNDCLLKIANNKKDISICDLVIDEKMKLSCYTDISKLTNNVDICKKVEADKYWNDICYMDYAVNNDNSDYCWFIEKDKENSQCFYDIAINNNDWEMCHDVTDLALYTKCNNVISQEILKVEPCLQINDALDRDSCIIRLAKKANDVTFCEEITYPSIKKDCLNKFVEE